MADCLIVTPLAAEFAAEIERLAGNEIDAIACRSAEEARAAYDGETILFGNPAQIAEILDDWPQVNWVQSSWAGVTPLINAVRRDYRLTGVKGVFGPQMSEYVFGYLLNFELRIAERRAAQENRTWYQDHSGVLEGKTIGVMGTGSIGAHIASTARAFGMTPIGFSRTGNPAEPFERTYGKDALEEFLGHSQHLVTTLPATPDTDDLLNARTLALLPGGGCFVNVGRSNVVDDDALIQALETGQLGFAALDVFDVEPLPDDSPLWTAPNLAVTAHIAAISHPMLIVPIFIDNFRRYRGNQPLQYIVDFDAGY